MFILRDRLHWRPPILTIKDDDDWSELQDRPFLRIYATTTMYITTTTTTTTNTGSRRPTTTYIRKIQKTAAERTPPNDHIVALLRTPLNCC